MGAQRGGEDGAFALSPGIKYNVENFKFFYVLFGVGFYYLPSPPRDKFPAIRPNCI